MGGLLELAKALFPPKILLSFAGKTQSERNQLKVPILKLRGD
jgi:hypothetical protein